MAMPSSATAKSDSVDKDKRKTVLKTHLNLDEHKINLDDFEPKDEVKIFKVVCVSSLISVSTIHRDFFFLLL